ncbi:MAG: nucleotidyl transferase AbiEii/AbiGii toxin family protein [Flavihumibacter sp.]|nr:nucleotidyl transferase AbiEii/AbiGii toxin family protein [Flavihumibacter sp.]
MSHQENISRIKAVHNALGPLKSEVVFVGGATVSLYADRQAEETRPTEDVDILIEITSKTEFAKLEEQLRVMGFENDKNAKFLGRYLHSGIVVDVMPTEEQILGFINIWYKEGFKTSINYTIDPQHTVKIFSPAYFIATKMEAFKSRGNNDGRMSSDFEDIVFVWGNRRSIWKEMAEANPNLQSYLIEECKQLHSNTYLEEWIGSHAGNSEGIKIIDALNRFVSQSKNTDLS